MFEKWKVLTVCGFFIFFCVFFGCSNYLFIIVLFLRKQYINFVTSWNETEQKLHLFTYSRLFWTNDFKTIVLNDDESKQNFWFVSDWTSIKIFFLRPVIDLQLNLEKHKTSLSLLSVFIRCHRSGCCFVCITCVRIL